MDSAPPIVDVSIEQPDGIPTRSGVSVLRGNFQRVSAASFRGNRTSASYRLTAEVASLGRT